MKDHNVVNRKRRKRHDTIQRILMMNGWRLVSQRKGAIVITPSPPSDNARRYEINQDDEPGWYAVYLHSKHGRLIDEQVPLGVFRTRGVCLQALIQHVAERTAAGKVEEPARG